MEGLGCTRGSTARSGLLPQTDEFSGIFRLRFIARHTWRNDDPVEMSYWFELAMILQCSRSEYGQTWSIGWLGPQPGIAIRTDFARSLATRSKFEHLEFWLTSEHLQG